MADSALAIGADHMSSVVLMTCDPVKYQWGPAQASRAREGVRRFSNVFNRLGEAMRENMASTAADRARDAGRSLAEVCEQFCAEHPAYSPQLVDELLDMPVIASNLLAYYDAQRDLLAQNPKAQRFVPSRVSIGRFDEDLGRLCDEGDSLLKALIAAPATVEIEIVTPLKRRAVDLFWFVYDPMLPAEIASAMTDRLRSEAAFLLLRAAQAWSLEDVRRLARARLDYIRHYARYVAGIPGNDFAQIPHDERLNVPALLDRAREGQAHLTTIAPRILEELKK